MVKKNYQLEMEKQISAMSGKPGLLLHSCCAPCSSSVMERLSEHFAITVLYYNPNIEPESEYAKRLDEQKRIIESAEFAGDIRLVCGEYDNSEFRRLVQGLEDEPEGGARCRVCIHMRMEECAKAAKKMGMEFFTTTLSVSPHKDAEYINSAGKQLEEKYGVTYLYADFKKKNGYKRSIELSEDYSLYRQNYCGCLFAKGEDK